MPRALSAGAQRFHLANVLEDEEPALLHQVARLAAGAGVAYFVASLGTESALSQQRTFAARQRICPATALRGTHPRSQPLSHRPPLSIPLSLPLPPQMATAVRVSSLHLRRTNLLSLLQLLARVESVAQCVSDLQLLLEASDYAGALDVLEDTRRVLEGEEIGRLHCFRHVGPHLDAAAAMLERLMTAEFVRIARVARPPGVLPASAVRMACC